MKEKQWPAGADFIPIDIRIEDVEATGAGTRGEHLALGDDHGGGALSSFSRLGWCNAVGFTMVERGETKASKGDLKIARVGADGTFAALGNVIVFLYRSRPTVDVLRSRLALLENVTKAHPQGVGVISIMAATGDGQFPDADARRESKRQIRLHEDGLVSSVLVIEGDSLYFTLLRSFLRGLALAARRPIQYRFATTVAEGSSALLHDIRSLPGTPRLNELERSIERLKAESDG